MEASRTAFLFYLFIFLGGVVEAKAGLRQGPVWLWRNLSCRAPWFVVEEAVRGAGFRTEMQGRPGANTKTECSVQTFQGKRFGQKRDRLCSGAVTLKRSMG